MLRFLAALLISITFATTVRSEPTTIMTWNINGSDPYRFLGLRLPDLPKMLASPELTNDVDVLILQEVVNFEQVKQIASSLGWANYSGVVSDWQKDSKGAGFGELEVAVISKVPIVKVIEYDASPDSVSQVFDQNGGSGVTVTERHLKSNAATRQFGMLAPTDRGTIRVDLDNGLSIFPVHLKSNRNSACAAVSSAISSLGRVDLAFALAERWFNDGFYQATDERKKNASKRERVIAAIKLAADEAVAAGRVAVIAGDFNTSFQERLAGQSVFDCSLQDFGCAKQKFPSNKCHKRNGVADGYDDTTGILSAPLIGQTPWQFLSRDLKRTYTDEAFADRAIDHIAVPKQSASKFAPARKLSDAFGSDHYPVWTVFTP